MFTREDTEEEMLKEEMRQEATQKEYHEAHKEWRALPRRTGWKPPGPCMNTDKVENARMRSRIALYSDPLLRNRERPRVEEE